MCLKSLPGAWDQLGPALLSRQGSPASSLQFSLMILCVPPMQCRGLTRCLEAL